jgi:hypothetical protein
MGEHGRFWRLPLKFCGMKNEAESINLLSALSIDLFETVDYDTRKVTSPQQGVDQGSDGR